MSRVSSLLAVSCLALLAVGTCAQQDWVQPSFIEEEPSQPRVWQQSTSDHLGPVTSLAMEESEPRSLVSTESTMSVSAEAQAQAQAMLAATVTAEGKTHAELLAEVEARAPALWADFKAKFKKVYKDEKARFATFTKNLLRIAALNAKVALSRIPQGLRAIFSQDNAHADLTEDEFKKLLGTAPLQSPNIPVAPPAPRRVIAGRGSSKIRKVFLELKAQIEADAAVDADADAETEVEAEADADADAEAETEMEAETFLPTPGQPCSNVGICSGRAEWCGAGGAAGKPVPYSGVCAGAAVCCMPKGVVPSAPVIPTPPTPTPTPVAPTPAPRPPTPAPAPAPVAPAAPVPPVDCDWRSMSSEIRHQGQCGSCWAHSAAATLETAYAIKTGIKLSLSPQQAVDCDTSSHGCNGGQPISALNWWAANGGAATEKKIPYWARPQGTCQLTKDVKGKDDAVPIPVNVQQAIKWTYWSGVPDENELGHQLSSSGVLSVNIDASTIQFYRYGIIDSTCGCQNGFSTINHAVNLEGLGTDAATKYRFWILRNSWSKDWGESGRFRLLFGQNTCAVGVNPVKTSVL